MKTSKFYISTLREAPAEAVISSHKLMLRAGITRKLGNGLYTYLPLGVRSLYKLENIIREEWNETAEALEFKPTVIIPGDLWKESGRWETMGAQMLKAKNRSEQDMVVSPTAEEAFTAIARDGLDSYKQLPINLYQINTKYRDEIRPRYGVMRGREFIMADGYTMNADDESLDESYKAYEKAYFRIFKRLGLKIIPVRADSGAMGGSGSQEFMVESPIGDDTLIICPNENCGYAANVEKAECAIDFSLNKKGERPTKTEKPIELVATPNVFSIEDMEKFFDESSKMFIKALIYRVINSALDMTGATGAENWKIVKDPSGNYYPLSYVCVLIRADLDVNEAKLAATLKASEVVLAEDEEILQYAGAPHGFVGPTTAKCPLVVDYTVIKDGEAQMHNAIAGAGKEGYHIKHVEPIRDFSAYINADLRTVKEGDKCACCGSNFYIRKGNELGHIFKLGHKYTHSMNVTFLGKNGKPQEPTMGCYGIGVDRTLASIIEANNDEKGIIWPMSVAPFQVCIVPIKYEGAMKETADKIYEQLKSLGVEVLLDDRNERPGVKFADMELIGIPLRITIGEKTLPNVEFKPRQATEAELVPVEEVTQKTKQYVQQALEQLNA
ncbi:proline--tRNA ligase [Treponema pectinovorum]|uniref:proline--tRNA ligase n=1 Tax=Treponema pectinovorum TaxID=164 RepID=UPI003D8D3243